MLVNLARLVFNQSCSVLRSVVRRRFPIMVLMLSLSSATSPRASTWIERVRSHLVTALAGDRSHLVGEGRKRVGHIVDGFGECRDLALRFHGQVLLEVAIGHRSH